MEHESALPRPSLTKILATLGPATDAPGAVQRLIMHGATLFRLNFSHGSFNDHAGRIELVHRASEALNRPIAILGDLPGPKIRVGLVADDGIDVQAGQDLIFRCDIAEAIPGATPVLACTYEPLVDEVEPGQRVLINDGAIRALAVERTETPDGRAELRCRVTSGGRITTGKGINLPESNISAPAITEKDWVCAEWAVRHGVDFIALSFVRRADEVRRLKERLAELVATPAPGAPRLAGGAPMGAAPPVAGPGPMAPSGAPPVIAKIEKPQAVDRIEEILDAADGIMVARGDLGVEMDLAAVPVTQKKLIAAAKAHGKPCIVATQMLESMIVNSSPTRAEVSDVANAIFDETDVVMLSGETAVGRHGALAVDMMRRVALATEERQRELPRMSRPTERFVRARDITAAVAHGAWRIAEDVGATIVACWSESGQVARRLSQIGLRIPIVAYSSNPGAVRTMALCYAVTPVMHPNLPQHRSEFARIAQQLILRERWANPGDRLVLVCGKPFGRAGASDTVSVHTL